MHLVALGLLLVPSFALAQLRLVVVEPGGSERPVESLDIVGSAAAGDTLDVTFRARNESTAAVTLDRLAAAGAAFSLRSQPNLPLSVAPGAAAEFVVRFAPPSAGNYSVNLTVNEASYILRATGLAALMVLLDAGGMRQVLPSGAEIDFGSVATGSTANRRFVLENRTDGRLPIAVEVTGADFRRDTTQLPAELAPAQSVAFDVSFAPQRPGAATGTLRVGDRQFSLRGSATDPPVPPLLISSTPAAPESGQQASVSVSTSDPVSSRVTGELTLSFTPSISGFPEDPTVQFAAGGRTVFFEIPAGQSGAVFGAQTAAGFQAGTTAGTLVFTARAGTRTNELRLTTARLPVRVTAARATRSGNELDIQLTSFDNTRTASRLTFTFYDSAGTPIGAPFSLDATESFRGYFGRSTSGGAFSLRAVFPVTGNAAQVAAVEIEIANSLGTTRSERLRF